MFHCLLILQVSIHFKSMKYYWTRVCLQAIKKNNYEMLNYGLSYIDDPNRINKLMMIWKNKKLFKDTLNKLNDICIHYT